MSSPIAPITTIATNTESKTDSSCIAHAGLLRVTQTLSPSTWGKITWDGLKEMATLCDLVESRKLLAGEHTKSNSYFSNMITLFCMCMCCETCREYSILYKHIYPPPISVASSTKHTHTPMHNETNLEWVIKFRRNVDTKILGAKASVKLPSIIRVLENETLFNTQNRHRSNIVYWWISICISCMHIDRIKNRIVRSLRRRACLSQILLSTEITKFSPSKQIQELGQLIKNIIQKLSSSTEPVKLNMIATEIIHVMLKQDFILCPRFTILKHKKPLDKDHHKKCYKDCAEIYLNNIIEHAST